GAVGRGRGGRPDGPPLTDERGARSAGGPRFDARSQRQPPGRRGALMTDLRLSSRRVALAAYRRLGSLGFRIMGPDPRDVNPNPDVPPWTPLPETPARLCVVCRWQGAAFEQPGHVELTICPQCGSNGRDRFLFWCLRERVELSPALRVIECSPRMGRGYRDAMSSWFFYRTTDFDQRAHRGNLRLDLQSIDLPDACVDVLLC